MIKCPYCGVDSFISILGLQDHLDVGSEDGCVNWCAKCSKERQTSAQLKTFIMNGGADGDCPQICSHAVD